MTRLGMLVPLLLATMFACAPAEPEFYGTSYGEGKPAENFTLTDQYGEPFHLADQAGKIVMRIPPQSVDGDGAT